MNPQSDPFQARMQFSRAPQSLLGKVLSLLLGATFLVLAVMFSVVALAVIAVAGVVFAGWFWWKTRALRKAMREGQMGQQAFNAGRANATNTTASTKATVIEGEFVREAPPTAHLPNNN
jgi:O-antigen/teichoic acid export membrane protein